MPRINTTAGMSAYLAKRRASGLCARCNEKAEPSMQVCARHRKQRPHQCMECEGVGHNSRTCPELSR